MAKFESCNLVKTENSFLQDLKCPTVPGAENSPSYKSLDPALQKYAMHLAALIGEYDTTVESGNLDIDSFQEKFDFAIHGLARTLNVQLLDKANQQKNSASTDGQKVSGTMNAAVTHHRIKGKLKNVFADVKKIQKESNSPGTPRENIDRAVSYVRYGIKIRDFHLPK